MMSSLSPLYPLAMSLSPTPKISSASKSHFSLVALDSSTEPLSPRYLSPSTPHISKTPPPMAFTRSKPPCTFETHGSTLFSIGDIWEVLFIGKTIRCFRLMGIGQSLLGSSVWSDQGRVMLVRLVQNTQMLFLSLIIQKIIAFMVV
ncbi:hypothetical protein SO802_008079 [Lithocarpus litseifolius]|uniref:Uncharacterized protein n=1 Tax=Lithocarpus litseifolius TaxID=425828 RepID=A0AAW2D7J6_9ROSI